MKHIGSADISFTATLRRLRPETITPLPWSFLEDFRQSATPPSTADDRPRFLGTWPSLTELFRITAWRFPDRPCYTVFEPDRVSLNFGESLRHVQALAAYLQAQGIKPGERVAVSGKNSPEWAISYLAVLFADAVVVPIDQVLSQPEMLNLCRASQSRMLIADADKLDALGANATDREGKPLPCLSLEPSRADYIYAFCSQPLAGAAPSPTRRGNDLAAILYTSGTTGVPKGVMLSHENLVSDSLLSQYHMPLTENDVFYALLPLHHSYTMLAVFIESLSIGAEVVFGKKLVISQVLKDLKAARVTMFLGVPLLFNRLLDGILKGVRQKGPLVFGLIRAMMWISGRIKKWTGKNPGKKMFHSVLEKASLDSIRICISGGGPLPASTFARYNQLGLDFVQGYGLTETSPIVALNPVWRYKVHSVGAMVPGVSVKIDVPDDSKIGEILLQGPMVMQGYFENPEATQAIIDGEGWLHTGDLGYVDEEGYLYLTGRAKNMIVTEGGKNVYPEEIEDCFQLYPEVDQVLVRGYVADARNQAEAIEVLLYGNPEVFKDPGGGINLEWMKTRLHEIVKAVNHQLHSHQKISKVTILKEAMEMTSTKKIRRFTVKNPDDGESA